MSAEEERLIVALEARIRDYERNLKKANQTTGREFRGMQKHAGSATRNMERDMVRSSSRINQALAATSAQIGLLARSMAAPLVAGGLAGGLTAIVLGARQATAAVADMKAQAETAGVSFAAFQELKFAAEQSKIGVDALTDGLKEMQLRADEFIDTGKGSGAEAFAQLGFHADDLAKRLKEPDKLFEEIIDRLSQLDRASQIRIADEIFGGTGGEQFVRLLEDGRRGIEEARDKARELGAVISDEVAAEAEELDRRFNEIATTLSTTMKTAAVTFADATVAAFDRVTAAVDRYQSRLNAAEGGAGMGALADPNNRAEPAPETDPSPGMTTPPGTPTPTPRPEPKRDLTFTPYKLPGSGSSGGSGRSEATREAERQEKAIRDVIKGLEDEIITLGMSEQAQRVYTEAQKAGVVEGSKEYAQIKNLVDAYYEKSDALEQTAKMQRFAAGLALDGVRDLTFAIDTGNEAVDRLLGTLIDAVAQAALLGEGPLAGLFGGGGLNLGGGGSDPWSGMRQVGGGGGGGIGSIISGGIGLIGGLLGFADGTANTGGQRGQVRGLVHGQEAVIPLPEGGRVPVHIQAPVQQSPAAGGTSRIEVGLSPDLEARILKKAEGQSVSISRKTTQNYDKGRRSSYESGGNPV